MRFLIDGYNLLHAIGWAAKPASGLSWERSRLRMLDWLAGVHGTSGKDVWIIFDAYHVARPGADQTHRDMHIGFSHQQTADDRIEDMILSETKPRELAVVSNDTRIQQAARRRGCQVWTCERYLDWLILAEPRETVVLPETREREKEEDATVDEMAEWLRVFEEPKKKPSKPR